MDLSGLPLTLTLEEIGAVSMSLPVKLYVISLRLKGGKHKVKGKKKHEHQQQNQNRRKDRDSDRTQRMKQDDGFASTERERATTHHVVAVGYKAICRSRC